MLKFSSFFPHLRNTDSTNNIDNTINTNVTLTRI